MDYKPNPELEKLRAEKEKNEKEIEQINHKITQLVVGDPGEEADLVITIDVDKLPKREERIQAPLIVEGVGGKPSERTLQLIIER